MAKAEKSKPARPPAMTEEEVRAFIAESSWQFAKRMPQMPHEYTLRRNAKDEAAFEHFVMNIRHHGYREKFGKTWYRYLDMDGWKYWTMGAPLPKTILINRARIHPEPPAQRELEMYDCCPNCGSPEKFPIVIPITCSHPWHEVDTPVGKL